MDKKAKLKKQIELAKKKVGKVDTKAAYMEAIKNKKKAIKKK
jgi:hypothetical protein